MAIDQRGSAEVCADERVNEGRIAPLIEYESEQRGLLSVQRIDSL